MDRFGRVFGSSREDEFTRDDGIGRKKPALRANGRYLTVGWSNTICCANGRTGGWNLFFDSIRGPSRFVARGGVIREIAEGLYLYR